MSAPYLGVNGYREREDDEGYSRPVIQARPVRPVFRSAETENLLIRAEAQAKQNQFSAEPLTPPAFGGVRK